MGHREADACGEKLLDYGISAVYASPLGRAVQTAEHFAEKAGLPIRILEFMREIEGGPVLNGNLPEPEELSAEFFEDYARVTEGFDNWMKELGYQRQGRHYRCTAPNEETIALFSHAIAGKSVLSHVMGMPPNMGVGYFRVSHTGITIVEWKGEVGDIMIPSIRTVNDHSHLVGVVPAEKAI